MKSPTYWKGHSKELVYPREKSILIIDNNSFSLQKLSLILKKSFFSKIATYCSAEGFHDNDMVDGCDLVLAAFSSEVDREACFSYCEQARNNGYNGSIVPISVNATCKDVYRSVMFNAEDFLFKGPHLNLQYEIGRILNRKHTLKQFCWHSHGLKELGLFRSAGLSPKEIDLIVTFANEFPRQAELAYRLDRSVPYINKMFSRIYEKLRGPLDIDNPSKLAHLVTICTLFKQ